MEKLRVVGLGPGHSDFVLPIAKRYIQEADILIGGKRHIESVDPHDAVSYFIEGKLKELPQFIRSHIKTHKMVVVVSGDTGFYSLLRYLKKQLHDVEIEATPGISSMQYLFSKLGLAWDDAYLGSLHGRELDLPYLCSTESKIGLLTDQKFTPQYIAQWLMDAGVSNKLMIVGERLSYEDERIHTLTLSQALEMTFDELNVVILKDQEVFA